jgi:hypothetical protein
MTSHRLSSCYCLIVALLLQGLIHRYGPALFRLAVQHCNPMPWLLSPTNAIDDLKIGLYKSNMYVIAGVTEHAGSVAAKELLAEKKPVKVIVRDATKGETWSKQGGRSTSWCPLPQSFRYLWVFLWPRLLSC